MLPRMLSGKFADEIVKEPCIGTTKKADVSKSSKGYNTPLDQSITSAYFLSNIKFLYNHLTTHYYFCQPFLSDIFCFLLFPFILLLHKLYHPVKISGTYQMIIFSFNVSKCNCFLFPAALSGNLSYFLSMRFDYKFLKGNWYNAAPSMVITEKADESFSKHILQRFHQFIYYNRF